MLFFLFFAAFHHFWQSEKVVNLFLANVNIDTDLVVELAKSFVMSFIVGDYSLLLPVLEGSRQEVGDYRWPKGSKAKATLNMKLDIRGLVTTAMFSPPTYVCLNSQWAGND